MTLAVEITRIAPHIVNTKKVVREVKKELTKEGRRNRRSLNRTITSWNNEKPTFVTKQVTSGDDISVFTEATGNPLGVKKWIWLNNGTSVRYAHMTQDFIAKTSPGRLISKPGRGQMNYVDVNNPANPNGIKAREWSRIIEESRQGPFSDNIRDVIFKTAIFDMPV